MLKARFSMDTVQHHTQRNKSQDVENEEPIILMLLLFFMPVIAFSYDQKALKRGLTLELGLCEKMVNYKTTPTHANNNAKHNNRNHWG